MLKYNALIELNNYIVNLNQLFDSGSITIDTIIDCGMTFLPLLKDTNIIVDPTIDLTEITTLLSNLQIKMYHAKTGLEIMDPANILEVMIKILGLLTPKGEPNATNAK